MGEDWVERDGRTWVLNHENQVLVPLNPKIPTHGGRDPELRQLDPLHVPIGKLEAETWEAHPPCRAFKPEGVRDSALPSLSKDRSDPKQCRDRGGPGDVPKVGRPNRAVRFANCEVSAETQNDGDRQKNSDHHWARPPASTHAECAVFVRCLPRYPVGVRRYGRSVGGVFQRVGGLRPVHRMSAYLHALWWGRNFDSRASRGALFENQPREAS